MKLIQHGFVFSGEIDVPRDNTYSFMTDGSASDDANRHLTVLLCRSTWLQSRDMGDRALSK